ncbi:MAG: efflux RND transporter periplasmic adaptor subunit [Polyangiales bacterium]
MSSNVRAWVAGLALAGLLSPGCSLRHDAKASAAFEVDKETVRIVRKGPVAFDLAEVKLGPALPLPSVAARVTTIEAMTSPSFPPLAGRVVEAEVHLGDHVEKGQPLVLIRTGDLPTLERDLRSAELAVKTRAASVERTRALVESRAGSQHDLALAESELMESRLQQQAARARLRSLQIARGKDDTDYWVLASRSGTVVQLDATPGSQVGPDRSTPVVTIADLADVLVVADVPPSAAAELHKGTRARVFPFGEAGAWVEGRVEVISEVVDQERQTVPVRVRASNAEKKLRPNAYVDLSFGADEKRTSVIVPAVAVVRDGSDAVVFVEREKGSFQRRAVVVGRRTRDEVEVQSGLRPGERVVTTGALLLVNALDIEA